MNPALREVIELAYTNWRWRKGERRERPLIPIVVEIELARWSPTAEQKDVVTRVGGERLSHLSSYRSARTGDK